MDLKKNLKKLLFYTFSEIINLTIQIKTEKKKYYLIKIIIYWIFTYQSYNVCPIPWHFLVLYDTARPNQQQKNIEGNHEVRFSI